MKILNNGIRILNFDSVSEKDLKDEITNIFQKITGFNKTVLCTTDKNTGKKYSTYPGFVGIRIKEELAIIYSEELYREFFTSNVIYTGKQTDRVFRSVLCDKFVDFVTNNHTLHPDTKGAQRYKIAFLNEFNAMFKKIFRH